MKIEVSHIPEIYQQLQYLSLWSWDWIVTVSNTLFPNQNITIQPWIMDGYLTECIISCPCHPNKLRTTFVVLHLYSHNGCDLSLAQTDVTKIGTTLTASEVYLKSTWLHEGKYLYFSSRFQNTKERMEIWCINCQKIFTNTPNNHTKLKKPAGCKRCGDLKKSYASRMTAEEFIQKAIQVHGDKYDYSLVVYVNDNIKVWIICSIHGEFLQKPGNHTRRKAGCPACGVSSGAEKRILDLETFIYRSELFHGKGTQDYSMTVLKGLSYEVKVRCIKHNKPYKQIGSVHLHSVGCPTCKQRGFSEASFGWLSYCLIEYQQRYKLPNIIMRTARSQEGEYKIPNSRYHADGMIIHPVTNQITVYEYHGCWVHGDPRFFKPHWIQRQNISMNDRYIATQTKKAYIESLDMQYIGVWDYDWLDANLKLMEKWLPLMRIKFRLRKLLSLNGNVSKLPTKMIMEYFKLWFYKPIYNKYHITAKGYQEKETPTVFPSESGIEGDMLEEL